MSNIDATRTEEWKSKLLGRCAVKQADSLRQISASEAVKGLTVEVVQLVESPDDEVRMWAAEALERAIQPDPSEVSRLIELLKNTIDQETGYWTVTMLGRLGTDSVSALDALKVCVRESSLLPARERATWALSQLGSDAVPAIDALREAARTAPPRLQRLAAQAIEIIQQSSGIDKQKGAGSDVAA